MSRLLILLAIFATATVAAEETGVYETLDDISIGRVFMTDGERRRLDVKRLETPAAAAPTGQEQVPVDGTPEKTSTPAGFIIRSNGEQSQWQGGDFVSNTSTALSSMRFPGEVEITRHEIVDVDTDQTTDSTATTGNGRDDGTD